MEKENSTYQFTAKKMWDVFKKQLGWILTLAVFVGCLGAFCGEFLIQDMYSSSITYILTDVGGASSSNLSQMSAHVERYRRVLTSPYNVIAKVTKKAGIEISLPESETGENREPVYAVAAMAAATTISTDSVAGTFTITVTCTDSKASYAMIKTFRELMSDFVSEYHLFPSQVLDPGSGNAPTVPTNGGRAIKFGALGAILGGALSYIVFLVVAVLDVTIRTTEDLEMLELPVLGEIPQYRGAATTGSQILNAMKNGDTQKITTETEEK